MNNNNGSEIGAFFAGFLVGGLVGAAAALILAPQSGAETREQIQQKSIELRGKAEDTLAEARAKAEAVAADIKRRKRRDGFAQVERVCDELQVLDDERLRALNAPEAAFVSPQIR